MRALHLGRSSGTRSRTSLSGFISCHTELDSPSPVAREAYPKQYPDFAADQAHHYSDNLMDCIREPHGNHWRVAGEFLIGG